MLLTLYYMATNWFQSYRLSIIKSNLKKYLTNNLTLVLYKEKDFVGLDNEQLYNKENSDIFLSIRPRGITSDSCKDAKSAQLDQILSFVGHKRSCSVLPEQILNVDSWILIPNNPITFPALLNTHKPITLSLETRLHLLVEATYRMFNVHQNVDRCLIEDFGVLKAWNAGENFGLLLETDLDHFAKLTSNFMANSKSLYLGNHMELLRIQTVKVEGQPCDIENNESIASNIDFTYSLRDNYDINNVTTVQWKNYCDTLYAVSVAATNVLKFGKPINFCSAVLSKKLDNEISMDDYVVVENVQDEVDSTIVKSVESKCFTESKIHKNTVPVLEIPKENHLKYVQFNNECELNIESNGKSNSEYDYESTSNTSSSDSISFRRIVLTPIEENEIKLSSGMKPIKSSPDVFGIYNNSLNNSMMRSHRSFSDFSNNIESRPRCHTPVQHSGESKTGKPPNIIIFSESASSAQQIQHSLESVLHRYRYTIYTLSLDKMLHSPWTSQATMVVVYGAVPDELYPLLEQYLLTEGGRILCLCSDFLGTLLPTAFSTAEVCSDDIVSFTYRPLSMRTSLLHHILCYQPSIPNNDHFPSENGIKEDKSLDIVDMFDTNNKHHTINIEVLAAEDTWETPSLILATAPSGGKVIFSQVHLEIDPHQNGEYRSTTEDRYLLIKDLLSTHLGLDCVSCDQEPKHTAAYLLGTENDKVKFLTSLNGKVSKNNVLLLKDLKVQFCTKDEMCIGASEYSLPVICNDFPADFSEENYFKNLHTEELGRLVIFGEVMSSSMKLLNDPISRHGLVVIPKQQITGIGRGGNKWLSPSGCAMFSVQLHIPFDSQLGQRLALLQHVVALSVVSAICSLPGGYNKLDLGLKWPNDIYAGGNAKIGGLVISSSASGNTAICSIGCGVNLNNSLPTTCINDIIIEHNANSHNQLNTLTYEQYFATVFTELERLLNQVQNGNVDIIFDLYYKYWLHSNTVVTVLRPNKSTFKATVIGLDDHGFLRVRSEDGDIIDVRPDGNSFDMLAGLIAPK
uniref:Biotin--protein ligase n=2 Tax=Schizaphis graminum TaxID=13262 RepID=A0A2S2NYB8_SCHGA